MEAAAEAAAFSWALLICMAALGQPSDLLFPASGLGNLMVATTDADMLCTEGGGACALACLADHYSCSDIPQ